MKKVIGTLVLALVGSAAVQAQSARFQGGVNLANVSVTSGGRVNEASRLTSFQVGVIGDFKLSDVLYLQPGLLYTGKGSKVQNGTPGTNGYYRQSFNPYYIELPVNLVAKAPVSKTVKVFAGAGPYLAAGVGGEVETEGQALGVTYAAERSIRFSSDDPTTLNQEEGTGLGVVRRFDYGLNGTLGIEAKSVVVGVNYGLGLAKLQSGSNNGEDNNNKHRVLSFTLGFKF